MSERSMQQSSAKSQSSEKSWLTTVLFFVLLGPLGAHRFYTGRVREGALRFVVAVVFGVCTFFLLASLVATAASGVLGFIGLIEFTEFIDFAKLTELIEFMDFTDAMVFDVLNSVLSSGALVMAGAYAFLALVALIIMCALQIIDLILIVTGRLKDADGKVIVMNPHGTPQKNRWIATVVLLVYGFLGAHRFYAGKIGTGVAWMLTFGMFGIGWLVDIVMVLRGTFKDKDGNVIPVARVSCTAAE